MRLRSCPSLIDYLLFITVIRDRRKVTELLIVDKIKKLDDMLVYTQKLKADHNEEHYCMEVEGVDWQILSMEQFTTFVIFLVHF